MTIQSPGSRQDSSSNWSVWGPGFCHSWLGRWRHGLPLCEHVLCGTQAPNPRFPKREAGPAPPQDQRHHPAWGPDGSGLGVAEWLGLVGVSRKDTPLELGLRE